MHGKLNQDTKLLVLPEQSTENFSVTFILQAYAKYLDILSSAFQTPCVTKLLDG